MKTFSQFRTESMVGGVSMMSPYGPNHTPTSPKKTREVEPDRVTLSPEAKAAKAAAQRAATSSPQAMAKIIRNT